MEISLNIDQNGRTIASDIQNDVSLDYSTKTSVSFHFKESIYPHLLQDCEKIVTNATLPWTFWVPSDSEPRFALEKLALDIFHHHIPPGFRYDSSTSGAEWWVQIRPTPPNSHRHQPGDETGAILWHWDKDEDLRVATGGLFIHPHLSTVTYLTSVGAPTMIFNSKVGNIETGEPNFEPHVDSAFISWPQKGKHLVFDGALLHGVPSELLPHHPSSNSTRVTFLVNLWLNYRPLAIQPFPADSFHDYLPTQELQDVSFSPFILKTDEIVYPDETGNNLSDCTRFEWTLGGPVVIQAILPIERIRAQRSVGGNNCIQWKKLDGVHILVKETS